MLTWNDCVAYGVPADDETRGSAAGRGKGDLLAEWNLAAVLRHFIEQHRPAPLPVACCC
ncbi:MAG: hypothetical protein JNM29_00845 [Candidatus Odyssella sp.]|nr:hypothetical protein [Candidatus Odyssella sp.]